MKSILLFAVLLVPLINSCSNGGDIQAEYPFLDQEDDEGAIALLFSDETDYDQENDYYDALITMQQQHPGMLEKVEIVSKQQNMLTDHFDVSSYPSLLIIDDMEEQVRVSGENNFSYIVRELESEFPLVKR
ncbi:hypothetical protein [Salisediminibacterium halotolerans]|uniref:hypothetical protein n=1 Tax=Salisediminibacterium halotolerans TaxID=517425 RepID=UPI000EB23DA2|nr:hypothetical protein [Salisediminibacterium halotolerans]RLJ74355.1 hypothetical protein BCL39_1643 [Actinophytocola xinjiangensis]RPE87552.1 hypothetical protein EDD67_1288 [Salisediminibacterium halotolerans]TWG35192.1 hypothetical protein BCL52_1640 [Salisediminibacterium halotolerans]GEL08870.1 hypothetical protein SHA02_22860 [Salisediminibacterium halotolerans]